MVARWGVLLGKRLVLVKVMPVVVKVMGYLMHNFYIYMGVDSHRIRVDQVKLVMGGGCCLVNESGEVVAVIPPEATVVRIDHFN